MHVFIEFSICDPINTHTHRPINKTERNQIIQLDSKGNQSEKVCFCCSAIVKKEMRGKKWGDEIDMGMSGGGSSSKKNHAHGSRKVSLLLRDPWKSPYDYVDDDCRLRLDPAPENSHSLRFFIHLIRSRWKSQILQKEKNVSFFRDFEWVEVGSSKKETKMRRILWQKLIKISKDMLKSSKIALILYKSPQFMNFSESNVSRFPSNF